MAISGQSLKNRCSSPRSRTLQGEHPLQIPTHRHQAPLATHVLQSSQEELAKSHRRFDDPEDRLGRLLAQGIELSARGSLQSMPHLLHCRGRSAWRLRIGCKAFSPALVMALTLERDQRLDARCRTSLDVLLAQISAVSQQALGTSQLFGQPLELLDHRDQLLFIVRRLRDRRGHYQQTLGGYDRLGVVGLIESSARHWHDARVLVREIDLLLGTHPTTRGLGWSSARLLARVLLLFFARGELLLIPRFLALLHASLDL